MAQIGASMNRGTLYVTFVEPEACFIKIWAQVDKPTSLVVEQTLKHMQVEYDSGQEEINPENIVPGFICCAKFNDDSYYRAKVLSFNIPRMLAQVVFLDYGNKDWVSFSRLKSLGKVPSLRLIPPLAKEFILANIQCLDVQWNSYVFNSLSARLRYLDFQFFVLSQVGKHSLVQLLMQGQDVKNVFIAEGLAINCDLSNQIKMLQNLQQIVVPPPPIVATPAPPKLLAYKSFPLDVGTEHIVYVSYVTDGPCLFSIQLQKKEEELRQLMFDINDDASYPHLEESPLPGCVCLARSLEDNYICRAVVTNMVDGNYKVFYVDFGNSEERPFNCLYQIPFKYVIPKVMATRFGLNGLQNTNVTLDMKVAFKDFVNEKLVRMKVAHPAPNTALPLCDLWDENGRNILEVVQSAALQSYPEALPLSRGSEEEVKVCYVFGCSKLFVQLKSEEEQLTNLMEQLQNVRAVPTSKDDLRPNAPCIAIFDADNKYYRGLILQVLGKNVKVKYVDYGNEEVILNTYVRAPIAEFVSALPPQAIECCLNGYQNMEDDLERDGHLEELLLDQYFTMKVSEIQGQRILVDLINQDQYNVGSLLLQKIAASRAQVSPTMVQDMNKIESRKPRTSPNERPNFRQRDDYKGRDNQGRDYQGRDNHGRDNPGRDNQGRDNQGREWRDKRQGPQGQVKTDWRSKNTENNYEKGSRDNRRDDNRFAGRNKQSEDTWGDDQGQNKASDDRWGQGQNRNGTRQQSRNMDDTWGKQSDDTAQNGSWDNQNSPEENRANKQGRNKPTGNYRGNRESTNDSWGTDNPTTSSNTWQNPTTEQSNDSWGDGGDAAPKDDSWNQRGNSRDSDNRGQRNNRYQQRDRNEFQRRGRDGDSDQVKSPTWNANKGENSEWDNNSPEQQQSKPYSRDSRPERNYKDNRGTKPYDSKPFNNQAGYQRRDDRGNDGSQRKPRREYQGGDNRSEGSERGSRNFKKPFEDRNQPKDDDWGDSAPKQEEENVEYVNLESDFVRILDCLGQKEKVVISWFFNPTHFYCQFVKNMKPFDLMMREIQAAYKNRKPLGVEAEVERSNVVIAEFPDDKALYRAEVLENVNGIYKVHYVDFGNVATTTKLFQMEKRFFEMPAQAVRCTLSEIAPVGDEWPDARLYGKHFGPPNFDCVFKFYHDFTYIIDLSYGNVSVRDGIIEEKLAKPFNPYADFKRDILLGQQCYCKINKVKSMSDFILEVEERLFVDCTLHNVEKATEKQEDLFTKMGGREVVVYIDEVSGPRMSVTLYDTEGRLLPLFYPNEEAFESVNPICEPAILSSKMPGFISHTTETSVFIQPSRSANFLETMLNQLFDHYKSTEWEDMELLLDSTYAVRSSDENWYRGRTLEIDGERVNVRFVDYGNTETVNKDCIRLLHPRFFTPLMAMEVQMQDGIQYLDQEVTLLLSFDENSGCWTGQVVETGNDDTDDVVVETVSESQTSIIVTEEERSDTLLLALTTEPQTLPAVTEENNSNQNSIGFSVILSHLDNPGQFYLQMTDVQEAINDLQQTLQDQIESFEEVDTIATGILCAAQYSVDQLWYRAQVLDGDSDITTVRFIDYGNTDVLDNKVNKIKMLSPELLAIEEHAKRCSLNLRPTANDWTPEALSKFEELTFDAPLVAEIINQDEKTCFVKLYSNEICVNDALLEANLAVKMEFESSAISNSGFVSHINSPSEFWFQFESACTDLEWVEEQMANGDSFNQLEDKHPGTLCAAVYLIDNGWYRARILSNTIAGIEVLFIDYGNSHTSTNLRELPEELVMLPPLAQKSSLLKPPGLLEWSMQAIEKFKEISDEGRTVFSVVKHSQGETSVLQLYKDSKDISTIMLPTLYPGVVTHFESLNKFFVRTCEDSQKLEEFRKLEQSNEKPDDSDVRVAVQVGESKIWHRAEFVNQTDKSEVYLIDEGKVEVIDEDRIFKLPAEWNEIPGLAKQVKMNPLAGFTWSEESDGSFKALMENSETVFQIEWADSDTSSLKTSTSVRLYLNHCDVRANLVATKCTPMSSTQSSPKKGYQPKPSALPEDEALNVELEKSDITMITIADDMVDIHETTGKICNSTTITEDGRQVAEEEKQLANDLTDEGIESKESSRGDAKNQEEKQEIVPIEIQQTEKGDEKMVEDVEKELQLVENELKVVDKESEIAQKDLEQAKNEDKISESDSKIVESESKGESNSSEASESEQKITVIAMKTKGETLSDDSDPKELIATDPVEQSETCEHKTTDAKEKITEIEEKIAEVEENKSTEVGENKLTEVGENKSTEVKDNKSAEVQENKTIEDKKNKMAEIKESKVPEVEESKTSEVGKTTKAADIRTTEIEFSKSTENEKSDVEEHRTPEVAGRKSTELEGSKTNEGEGIVLPEDTKSDEKESSDLKSLKIITEKDPSELEVQDTCDLAIIEDASKEKSVSVSTSSASTLASVDSDNVSKAEESVDSKMSDMSVDGSLIFNNNLATAHDADIGK